MKRRSARRVADPTHLDEDMLAYLLWGDTLGAEPSLEQARETWQHHRAAVIAAAKADPLFRYAIPWAFWQFEAPEPRRQLAGPAPLEPVELWRGEPKLWRSFEDAQAAKLESEREFLRRLGIDPDTLQRKKRPKGPRKSEVTTC